MSFTVSADRTDSEGAGCRSNAGLQHIRIFPGTGFLKDAARLLVDRSGWNDVERWRVLVGGSSMAADFRNALLQQAKSDCRACVMPRVETLSAFALLFGAERGHADILPMPESVRLLLLYQALAERNWLDRRSLWSIAAELAGLFDELTEHALSLPDDEQDMVARLEKAYLLRGSQPLRFEARLVHELWNVVNHFDAPGMTAYLHMRLKELADAASVPLFVIASRLPSSALADFFTRYARSAPVVLVTPDLSSGTMLADLIGSSGLRPTDREETLFERAERLRHLPPTVEATEAISFVAAHTPEEEAVAIAAQVHCWLRENAPGETGRRIALIAQDRLSARRVRALLERNQIMCADETGWKLSTARAAALIDALLQVCSEGAHYSDVLDLLKAPAVGGDLDPAIKGCGLLDFEHAVRQFGAIRGFAAFQAALDKKNDAAGQRMHSSHTTAQLLLDRVKRATACFDHESLTLTGWIDRLLEALDELKAIHELKGDAAGDAVLSMLEQRREELQARPGAFSFVQWRQWLDREFENQTFRDKGIASPVVMTSLSAALLRPFDAAIVIGGDTDRLRPQQDNLFFNQAVRRELGLPTTRDARSRLYDDLALLLQTVPRVVVTWQCERDGEQKSLAGMLMSLSLVCRVACNSSLLGKPLRLDPARKHAFAEGGQSVPHVRPLPEMVPGTVSVSAYQTLIQCPYLFFVRHMLNISSLDEISEDVEKNEYGMTVHQALEIFHSDRSRIAGLGEGPAIDLLVQISERIFEPLLQRNPIALGWLLRWKKIIPSYIRWQLANEAAGWTWQAAETRVERAFELDDGASVVLKGRIDRIDVAVENGVEHERLLDYKTLKADALKKRRDEEVQLPLYLLLYPADHRVDAQYLALEGSSVEPVGLDYGEEAAIQIDAHAKRLKRLFGALRNDTPLPANGSERTCRWCEARGLCRKDYWPKEIG